jgi:hypothetical protein
MLDTTVYVDPGRTFPGAEPGDRFADQTDLGWGPGRPERVEIEGRAYELTSVDLVSARYREIGGARKFVVFRD